MRAAQPGGAARPDGGMDLRTAIATGMPMTAWQPASLQKQASMEEKRSLIQDYLPLR